MKREKYFVAASMAFFLLLSALGGASALSVSITQSGADNYDVMKDSTFTVEASGWSGDCSQATISFSGCSSCTLSGESTQKTISTGAASVSWTTVGATQTATAQTISVSVSSGCTLQQQASDQFNIVLPPSLTVEATPSASSVNAGSSFTVNLNVHNSGETTARDVSMSVGGTGMSISSGCSTISTIDEGQSAAQPCTITASTAGTYTASLTASPSNAESASDSFSMTVNSVGGVSPGGTTGPSGTVGAAPSKKNTANKKFTLVPGVGLRDNAKLQEAMEKVLAKGKLSDQAKENLLRLSASIASDTEITKYMESSKTKSNITLRIKYNGNRKVMKFMLYEKLPKAFASSSDDVTVSVSGASYEIIQKDPDYLFTFPEMAKGEATITFNVNREVNTTALEQTATEVYGEVYEGLTQEQICGPGETKCFDNDLAECSADQKSWNTVRTCQYGCENGACKPSPSAPAQQIDWQSLLTLGLPALIIVAVLIAIVAVVKKRGGKKKFSPPKPMPQPKERPENLPS